MQLPRRALWLSCNILNSLFKMKLTSEETRRISRQCNWLRCILSNLRWSLTIWVHILVVHVPSYVEQWGSLRLFSTYAVEGSHRWLKKGFLDVFPDILKCGCDFLLTEQVFGKLVCNNCTQLQVLKQPHCPSHILV